MNQRSGPDALRVAVLSSHFPNPLYPHWSRFSQQQLDALAGMCRLGVVTPVAWPEVVRRGRLSLPARREPYPVTWPLFWYLPRWGLACQPRHFLWSAAPSLRRLARELRPQVLLGTWLFPDGWAGLHLARRLGLPYALKLHGSDLMVYKDDPRRLPFLQEALAGADLVLAVSRPLGEEAARQGARRVEILPNGLDHERFHPESREDARRELGLPLAGRLVLYVGRLQPVKGPDLALEALARLGGEAKLVMVGDGPLEEGLKARAGEPDLAGRVIWAGRRPHAQVARFLAAADGVLLPSRSEGDPNVVLEGLGAGRPVAASRVGGAEDALTGPDGRLRGALARPGDAGDLARALGEVLARDWDPAWVNQAVAARTWENSAARLRDLLAGLVRPASPGGGA
ncbi:MAG: glycosyltransferase [Deltaproteobacteria bacterium]|nr:glycosyltransferase [Deltaproteobacteria bacterium]